MPMAFFDDPRAESRTPILISRMMALFQAVSKGSIAVEELQKISEQSTASLESKWGCLVDGTISDNNTLNKSLKKLYGILKHAPEVSIKDATPLMEGLKRFDSEHGEYLPLTPMAIENDQTLALSLNDFATFYTVFIRHMACKKQQGELHDQYEIKFNALAARTDWLQWEGNRPSHVRFDPSKSEHPALFEKFLANQLKGAEWLSDLDIRRELTLLKLEKLVHILPFKADDIGLALHFEREKHELDDPKIPYVIPLIVNLGEDDHSRINSRGIHWTRLLVKVVPNKDEEPLQITVEYNDELFLPEGNKKKIEEVLNTAVKYETRLGGYSQDQEFKVYKAFPECDKPTITVQSSGEQRDGFTCGYRALRGILQDLIQNNVIEQNDGYKLFLQCHDATSLRNFVYRSLLGNQRISNETKKALQAFLPDSLFKSFDSSETEQFVVNPTFVEGQLLAFSHTTGKKTGKKEKLSSEQLKELEQLVEQNKKIEALREIDAIKNIATSEEDSLSLNFKDIIQAVEEKDPNSNDPNLIVQIVFEQVRSNKNLVNVNLSGVEQINPQFLYEKIDSLPARIKLISEEANLKEYLEIINARNELIESNQIKVLESSDPWDSWFEHILFTPSNEPGTQLEWMNQSSDSKAVAGLGVTGFSKLLHYIADHEDRFVDKDFRFKAFDMTHVNPEHEGQLIMKDSGLDFLRALREHLESSDSFIPFKQFNFTIPNLEPVDPLIKELKGILEAMKAPGLEKLEINCESLDSFSEEALDALITFIREKQYPTVLSFTASKKTINPTLQAKLRELENTALINQRARLSSIESPKDHASKAKTKEPVVLGKIGKAILKTDGLGGLDTEVQIQEEQQQQVQQQIQTSLDDEELPEEDEIQDEPLMPFADTEELLTRNIIGKLAFFISQRHPHLTPEQCWDLITGPHADLFKYGIKKMTVSAAKVLIENLKDIQYGLNPDNLPRGFSLQQDKDGAVVLAYSSFNPPINPNESPLTIRFSKPLGPNQWSGNALQFMTREQAQVFYNRVIEPMKLKPKPTLDECISQFFFLKSDKYALSDSQRLQILNGFIAAINSEEEASILNHIETIFQPKLSSANIKALSEVLYEQGPKGLSQLLEDLNRIKTIKGEQFFASFKTCFIDPSKNLNELTTDSSHNAMQKLLTLSSAQAAWWVSLTEQHSSNLNYQPETDDDDFFKLKAPGDRWANLAELTEGFSYFCGQLDEVSPGLGLTEYCPLTEVADMRVALDRLLTTILPHALNVDEQFYQGLQGLSLAPLGPFYASRYEGYKLVTPEMMLDLENSYSNKSRSVERALENKDFSLSDFCFRCDNLDNHLAKYLVNSDEKTKSLFLRYIAPLNHRAPINEYLEAYKKIFSNNKDRRLIEELQLNLIAIFGTGKRGKNFTQNDVDCLVKIFENYGPSNQDLVNLYTMWLIISKFNVRPTISEIIDISNLALITSKPTNFIVDIIKLLEKNTFYSEPLIEALLILKKNNDNIGAENFINIVKFIQENAELGPQIKAAMTKILSVCNSKDIDESPVQNIGQSLCTAVIDCFQKYGHQITSDLLELLGNIDVGKSINLPSVQNITALINEIAANRPQDYNALVQTVKSKLPEGCVIQMEKVTASPVEPAGNLHMIITKYMGEIRKELSEYKDYIGEEFFDSLATPEGTKILLDKLDKVSEMTSFLGGVVQEKIKNVMLKVYDRVMDDGQDRIGIKNDEVKARVARIINKNITHPIKMEPDFQEFCKNFANELKWLNQFLGSLQIINKTWPSDFRSVLDTLDMSSNINLFPLSLLAHISGALANNFDKNAPFPINLLGKFLSFKRPKELSAALKNVIDEIFDKEKTLTDPEKNFLCELAIRYCDTAEDPCSASEYIKVIIALKEADKDLFLYRLKLLSSFDKIDNQAKNELAEGFKILQELSSPELSRRTVDYFTEEKIRGKDFLPILNALGELEVPKRSFVLAIVLKAAQQESKEDQGDLLQAVVRNLGNLDLMVLKQLDALYRSPKHPKLSSLNELLSDAERPLNVEVMNTLQAEYDRDFWEKTEGKIRDFESNQLPQYLDNLQDMNYERPLLLSQRKELQRWFLYINTIGNNRGIPTQPWGETDEEGCKPIKEMSHDEIQGLLQYYSAQLKKKELTKEEHLKIRLEAIALLREAMYRGTGQFPRATQILYLLTAMQNGQDFIAQIQTGQGKSMIAGLAAAMANMEGKTVDICTSNLFLAEEGLTENRGFFEYLGMRAKLIHAHSGKEDYQENEIHYSSMSELALHRSKMQLLGKVFPDNCSLISDEVDFSTLDDSTRYRYAASLDPTTDPYHSPYIWIYESLVQFVDTQNAPKSDEEFIELAKTWLRNSAKTKTEKAQLKNLEAQPEVYNKRLETWLVAAGKTNQLVEMEQVRFRVVPLEHKKYGSVSKACILTGGRPNIQAEFSNTIQQFLHVRLRQKYSSEINQGKMPDFLVEPEKTYITTLNSKILLNTYQQRMGMSGTVGSKKELKEQYAKYGFRFVDIPPFTESQRQDLKPILTNPKYITNLKEERRDHINRIVKEILHYLSNQNEGRAGPILIHCANKKEGEDIYDALIGAIDKNPKKYQSKFQAIQRFYSSEKSTPEARNQEEQEIKEKASHDGMITISTVFGRGTDIKPTHANGLYAIDTFVDTEPYSSEDLERSKRQKMGRSGRAGQLGFSRLIVRRSEFSDIYTPKQMKQVLGTSDSIDQAISGLNRMRNEKRVIEREMRESFDDVKDLIYQEFFKYIQFVNSMDEKCSKTGIRNQLTKQWNLVLNRIDNYWDELQHDPHFKGDMSRQLEEIAQFACEQWNELAKDDGVLRKDLTAWVKYNELELELPKIERMDATQVAEKIKARKPELERFYVKQIQQYGKVNPSVSEAAVYSDFMSSSKFSMMNEVTQARAEATNEYISNKIKWLSTPAHFQKLRRKSLIINRNDFSKENVKNIMRALLYLRYKAYTDGNPIMYARLSQECRLFESQMIWSQNQELIEGVVEAQQDHFNQLTYHRGKHEPQKGKYLSFIMCEARKLLPEQTSQWKKESFAAWWGSDEVPGIKAQAESWLFDYKNKWWTRSWVSNDRKRVVTRLLEDLQEEENQSPIKILESIAKARNQLLDDDKTHSRSFKDGAQGRLFQYLDELELKIQAAMTPEELDENTNKKLDGIWDVLQKAMQIKGLELPEMLPLIDAKTEIEKEKYQALLVFFSNVALMSKPKKANNNDLEAFKAYCQKEKSKILRYFGQCDKNSSFNQQRSIPVYQALSEAAAVHFQRMMEWGIQPQLNLPENEKVPYRDEDIPFKITDTSFINQWIKYPLFLKVNQCETYRELLSSLEKSIVEWSPNDTQVKFMAITLDKTKHYPEKEGFKLSIEMTIDGVPVTIEYHINMKTGEMYCDDHALQKLNEPLPKEPELSEFTGAQKFADIKAKWGEMRKASTNLAEATLKTIEEPLAGVTKNSKGK